MNIKKCSFEKLIRKTSSELEFLRKEYRKRTGESDMTAQWLTDNFYMLEREGRTSIRVLSSNVKIACKNGFPEIYQSFIEKMNLHDAELTQEQTEEILKTELAVRPICTRELDLLPFIIKAALISCACDAIGAKNNSKNDIEKLGNSIKSLRSMSEFDFEGISENYNTVEEIFKKDPAGVYPEMDRQSRVRYRNKLAVLSEKSGISENEMAKQILKDAQKGKSEIEKHIGYHLLEKGKSAPPKSKGKAFLVFQAIIPLIATLIVCFYFGGWLISPLIFFALWEVLKPIVNLFQPKAEPRLLPRMETGGKIPETAPTAVVVSNLLPQAKKANEISSRLESLYLTNGDGNIMFGILADFKGAKSPNLPEDKSALNAAKREVFELNKKYGNHFFIAVRERRFSRTQNIYSGWERKRGAIIELIRYIKGRNVKLALFEGDKNRLKKVTHIIALDADTRLLIGTASELIATAIHPLNRPVVDKKKKMVVRGYGILAPKIGTDLISAGKTAFARIMTGVRGISPYGGVSADIYQDLFGSGIFSGKGVIDVDAFYALMDDAFPEETVLSHDILEGSILRTGYVSDIEMIDGVPSSASAWLSRQHRWIRGDWQNVKWLFNRKKISALGKYQLFDNLRRSLIEPIALILLVASIFFSARTSFWIAVISVLSIIMPLWFSAIRSLLAGGIDMFARRYYSSVMSDTRSNFARGVLLLVIMPAWAIMAIDAILRSIWRQAVSKKNLLEWTTAADSNKKGNAAAIAKEVIPPTIIGVILFGIGTSWLHKLVGAVFLCTVVVFTALSKSESGGNSKKIKQSDKEKIYSWTAAMWHFYEKYCTAKDHYLPPDNVQEAPVSRIAHRTSPTNIGLYLLSVLSANDFGFITTHELSQRISNTIETIERLPKWHGNLYNWYNTKNLSILKPAYVSAVDSGNFAVSLVALKEGLKELKLFDLANRVKKIADDIDLSPFYNERRKLFHIGYDCEKEELSNSFYDLLMSEARSMSYYAVARRQVSSKHWGALGRTLVRQGGHLGAVSWTGTMFEYYMPQLYLPVYEGTLSYESLKFAQHSQQKRAEIWNIPWGISESGFYSFDGDLNYQYKAHGVQKIGLKRGLDDDLVISPYSSFLLMPFTTDAVMSNLKRLEKIGMVGRCGFYEAVDYTKSRRGSRDKAFVRSYMAHHVGMSIVACTNTVFDNLMQKRFMSDKEMSCATELLEERVPSGAIVFDDEIRREVPDKPNRRNRQIEAVAEISSTEPKMHILSNGEWTLSAADTGVSLSIFRNIDINVSTQDILRRPNGFFAVIDSEDGEFSITAAPDYSNKATRRVEFAPDYVAYYAQKGALEGIMKASVHPSMPCEERRIIIKNQKNKRLFANLLCYLEPSLTEQKNYYSHPMFSKLFIEPTFDRANNMLIFEKRPRSNEEPLFLAVGFSKPFQYDTSRERILDKPHGISSLMHSSKKDFSNKAGVPDPCMAAKFSLEFAAKEEKEIRVWLCAANSKNEVVRILAAVRDKKKNISGAVSPFAGAGLEERLAPEIISALLFGGERDAKSLNAARENRHGVQQLWRAGISGDYPIILAEIKSDEEMVRTEVCIQIHSKLRASGIMSDLVFVLSEGGDYTRPQISRIRKVMRECGCENLLGMRAGVHNIEESRFGEDFINLLRASSSYTMPENITDKRPKLKRFEPMQIQSIEKGEYNGKDGFRINKKPTLPWCMVLANPTFGTIISDTGGAFTWAVNARENKLTPWYNDTRSDNNGEMLFIKTGNTVYDLTNGSLPVFFEDKAEYYGKAEEFTSKVKITVPEKGTVKYCDIEIENKSAQPMKATLAYYTEPVLGVGRQNLQRHLCAKWENNSLIFRNSFNTDVPGVMLVKSSQDSKCTCSREAFWSGKWGEYMLAPLADSCGAVLTDVELAPNEKKNIRFTLAWAANEQAVKKLADLNLAPMRRENAIKIHTHDKALNRAVNTWLPQQIINSRMYGRTGFYQCGGAWGFRDQLQDSCAMLYFDAKQTKRHIIRAAAKQFPQGDVLHWWHQLPSGLRGVRTLCSDDYLWLVYTTAQYIERTGDTGILDIEIPFIEGEELTGEHEKYITPKISHEKATLREHCIRAIRYGMKTGANGIPLMGNGDWNDGMNLVGADGRGESVWLGMFFALTLEKFAPFTDFADELIEYSKNLKTAIDEKCWDGEWYLRAFYDDGSSMGSHRNEECKIDSLPQSFSYIADMPDASRREIALDNALKKLVDWKNGVVHLFDPPFQGIENPGYIASYNAGLRENGGQYTHAAVWLAIAAIKAGREEGIKLIELLLPENRETEVYQTEPYAMPADIYGYPSVIGRGGWTLYTGAAGWYYRAVIEELLGIGIKGDKIEITPKIPKKWLGTRVELNWRNTKINISLTGKSGEKTATVPLDGNTHEVFV